MCKKKISAEDSFRTTALPANVATVSNGTRVSVLSPEDSRFTSVPSPFFLYSPLPTIKNSKTMSPDCTVQVNRPLPYSGTEKSVALATKTGVKICYLIIFVYHAYCAYHVYYVPVSRHPYPQYPHLISSCPVSMNSMTSSRNSNRYSTS